VKARFDQQQRAQLLALAESAVEYGIQHREPMPAPRNIEQPQFDEHAATFVTLHRNQQLRGCIGTLDAYRPLSDDLVANAYAAGFRDPRFPALCAEETAELSIHISVLSAPEMMQIRDEADLVAQLRPEIDGLIIAAHGKRATFLPSVWKSLDEPHAFLAALKQKAGLPVAPSAQLQAWRYTSESFPE